MATAMKPKKSAGKAQPTPPTPPPAQETRVLPDGTIERYKDGRLIKSTPPPKANGTPPAAAKPPKQPAAKPQAPSLQAALQANSTAEQFLGKRGSEDIWGFTPRDPKDLSQGVVVTRYRGYTILQRQQRSEAFANKLWNDTLQAGFEFVDGVNLRLIDEDA